MTDKEPDMDLTEDFITRLLAANLDTLKCELCGQKLTDNALNAHGGDLILGLMVLEPGHHGGQYEPPEDDMVYFVCPQCHRESSLKVDGYPGRTRAEISDKLERTERELKASKADPRNKSALKKGYLEGYYDALKWVLNEYEGPAPKVIRAKNKQWQIPDFPPYRFENWEVDRLTYPAREHIYYGVEIAPLTYILTGRYGKVLNPPLVGIKAPGAQDRLLTVLAWDEYIKEIERSRNGAYRAGKWRPTQAHRGGKV